MSVPPDMLQALQGGAAPQGAALPPDLLAALGGGGPAPEEAAAPSVKDGAPGGGEESLTIAIDAIQDAIDAESDQEDVQVMLQCQAKLQSILAKNQADQDGMMQGKSSPKAMRKATAY